MLRVVLVTIICLIFISNPTAQVSNIKSVEQSSNKYKVKPTKFPDEDEIKSIKKRTPIINFPRLTFNIGGSFRKIDNAVLNETFDRIESRLGAVSSKTFQNPSTSINAGLRLHINKKYSFWWDVVLNDNPLEEEDEEYEGLSIAYTSFSFIYTLNTKTSKGPKLSLGVGIGAQRIKAGHTYSYRLDDGGTLNSINIDTGKKSVYPLTLLFEVPGVAQSRYSFYICSRYILASDAEIKTTINAAQNEEVALKASMEGFLLTVGISAGF